MGIIRVTLKVDTDRDPDKVTEYLTRCGQQAGEVLEVSMLADLKRGTNAQRVMGYIEENPGCSTSEIGKALGMSPSAISRAAHKLRFKLRVERVNGRYLYYPAD